MNSEIVGREEAVDQVLSSLANNRLITLTGAGGIGKTTLAITIAQRIAAERQMLAPLVQLASLSDREAILPAIAKSIGYPLSEGSPCVDALAQMLTEKNCILVLDNAEHVVGDVAAIVETLLDRNAKLRVLVTSREPLHLSSEAVFRVAPLEVPPYDATTEAMRASAAIQLFLSRAPTLSGASDDAQVMTQIAEICRRLDGLPLAIELAAARIPVFGLQGVLHLLDSQMTLLSGGYRTDSPRHQTLRATFDWSFGLLGREAQLLFSRIAVFRGAFTLEAMCDVLCDDALSHGAAIDGIHELVTKSLINVEFDGPLAKYRLNESTRAYAFDRLAADGEMHSIASRYGQHLAPGATPVAEEEPKPQRRTNPPLHQISRTVCVDPVAACHGDGDPTIAGRREVNASFDISRFPLRVSHNSNRSDNGHEVFANLTAVLR
ncbi:MAG TPA: NB-ARC domain-containing protein, partial [Paraburkholderia sp.]|nr:NB-ARC domain-containing protein [Paraburkholderia sp.]